MKIMIIGSGGREHALAHFCARHPHVQEVLVCPGNPGMEKTDKVRCLSIGLDEHDALIACARREAISLAICGPEQALCAGIIDKFVQADIPALGPNAALARLEGSKVFAKEIMHAAGIPTARYHTFTTAEAAKAFIDTADWSGGFVVKADELAAGKGVIVCDNREEAQAAVHALFSGTHLGSKVSRILVEERLCGREISSFFLCYGKDFLPLGNACDYKRLHDNNRGPNTGGMGAYSPVPWLTRTDEARISDEIVGPLLRHLARQHTPYSGILFVGVMLTETGPQVLEFNVRLGDPETQCVLPLHDVQLLDAITAVARCDSRAFLATIAQQGLRRHTSSSYAVHVVCAAKGYPGTEGTAIQRGDCLHIGSDQINDTSATQGYTYFSGVKKICQTLVSDGGRVLGFTGIGSSLEESRQRAYQRLNSIDYHGKMYRSDIGRLDMDV